MKKIYDVDIPVLVSNLNIFLLFEAEKADVGLHGTLTIKVFNGDKELQNRVIDGFFEPEHGADSIIFGLFVLLESELLANGKSNASKDAMLKAAHNFFQFYWEEYAE